MYVLKLCLLIYSFADLAILAALVPATFQGPWDRLDGVDDHRTANLSDIVKAYAKSHHRDVKTFLAKRSLGLDDEVSDIPSHLVHRRDTINHTTTPEYDALCRERLDRNLRFYTEADHTKRKYCTQDGIGFFAMSCIKSNGVSEERHGFECDEAGLFKCSTIIPAHGDDFHDYTVIDNIRDLPDGEISDVICWREIELSSTAVQHREWRGQRKQGVARKVMGSIAKFFGKGKIFGHTELAGQLADADLDLVFEYRPPPWTPETARSIGQKHFGPGDREPVKSFDVGYDVKQEMPNWVQGGVKINTEPKNDSTMTVSFGFQKEL